MVRLFKVSHLEEKRRVLLERSTANRLAIKADVASLKASVDEVRQVAHSIRASWRRWAGIAALAGILVAWYRKSGESRNLLSRVLSGVRLGGKLMAIFKNFKTQSAPEPEHDGKSESVDA
jgi:hypothetical protein